MQKSLCKNHFAGYLYSMCSRRGVSLLVKQRFSSKINPVRPTHNNILFSAQNAFPAGHCTTVPLTVNIPAQWLWLLSQLGCVSYRRECFALFSTLLFCSWLEQAAVSGVNFGPLPIAVSDVNTFLNVWLLALFPNRSQKYLFCTTLICLEDIPSPLPRLLLDGAAELFLQFKQAN